MEGVVTNIELKDENNQKDYYDKAVHYDKIWGEDNIHLGYYPHISGPIGGNDFIRLNNVQAADMLTKRMIDLANIKQGNMVLDLGCGKGQSTKLISDYTGAKCIGLDLGSVNVDRAKEVASKYPHLNLKYVEGSFTNLPREITENKYDIIFSQVAFCHVHKELCKTLNEIKKVMTHDALLVVNDYIGCDKEASENTKEHVWKRLHFDHLHGHKAWRSILEENGFELLYYENLDNHMAQTYKDMAVKAADFGFKSTDGANLSENYLQTVKSIENGEIGMNLGLYRLSKHID